MVVLLSSRGFLGKQVFGAFLAAPVAFLHHVLHHRGPRPFEILGIATVGHPAIQAVLLFARQLLAGQPQALRLFPAGEVLLPNPSLLGLLPLPLNLRIYVHVCSVSFANSANYLYGLAPHTYGVSHVLATSRYILFSSVGFGWVVRAVTTILTAHARRLLNCYHHRPCSCFFRCPRLCLVRPRDRVLGRRDGYGHLQPRGPQLGRDLPMQISAKIEFYKVIAAHVAS